MEIEENGLTEGIAALSADLERAKTEVPRAFAAAVMSEQSDMLDEVATSIPSRTGELVGSGFVDPGTGDFGFGSDHAWRIGDQFEAVLEERGPGVAERALERVNAGQMASESHWPASPQTHGVGISRRRDVGHARGTKRGFK